MPGRTKRLCLVDGNSYIHRAYHAIRGLTNSRGLPTNAVYGYLTMLLKVLREETWDLVAVVFDAPGPTFRHRIFPDYKANRPRMPDDLAVQLDYVRKLTAAFGITAIQREGVEADDVLATLARRAREEGMEVLFVTGDKDIQQLLDKGVSILDTMKDRRITMESLSRDRGLRPGQLVDVMALEGDPSDNIPGVPGIGRKTAESLVKEFGSLEGIYEHLDRIPGARAREALAGHREEAELSRRLVRLKDDLDVSVSWKELEKPRADSRALKEIFEELEFRKFLRELDLGEDEDLSSIVLLTSAAEVKGWLESLDAGLPLSLCLEAGPGEEGPLALALTQDGKRCVVLAPGEGGGGLPAELVRRTLSVLEKGRAHLCGFDLKGALRSLGRLGIEVAGLDLDVLLASYVLDPSDKGATLADLEISHLGSSTLQQGTGGARGQKNLFADPGEALRRAATGAGVIHQLQKILRKRLEDSGMTDLYRTIELPLVAVLKEMEEAGIALDVEALGEMSKELETILHGTEEQIYRLAGTRFNVASPKQLAEVLFDRLGLPVIKKTKTGLSTNEEVLRQLAARHELPALLLSHRQLVKLKNTYVDVLPQLVSKTDDRLHTTFNQAATATGRLSSSNPNLQNIPVRSEWGGRIRRCFVAREGWSFVSADYSQIELRVLAHLSGDETLVGSFRRGEDIHTRTAMEIFGVGEAGVAPEMRRAAKTINFGIIYGMSPFGLSRELGVGQKEAREYIDNYFQVYTGVRSYLDGLVAGARKNGYVSTLFGRRRYLKELQSDRPHVVQFAERAALNTPIQGTAADLIKLAMIEVHRRLAAECPETRLLVQIHDELLLEAPPKEVPKAAALVKECMETAGDFEVPIVVDLATGPSWGELRKMGSDTNFRRKIGV